MDFNGKTIAVSVCGGVAAYRACDLVRELYRRGAGDVIVLLSEGSKEFVTPLTFRSLARNQVFDDAWALSERGTPLHIAAAQEADAMLIMPATANMMAKMVQGIADDIVSTTVLTFTDKPVVVVPAMNHRMWRHPATQENMQKLKERDGVIFVNPCEGDLACGETGMGHLADQEEVLQELYRAMAPWKSLYKGKKAIVTAGGTAEMIDPVRLITNKSSGKMGVAFADELYGMGADVTLIATDTVHPSLLSGRRYDTIKASSAADMQSVLSNSFPHADLLVMSAAVSDFTVDNAAKGKIKRGDQKDMALQLTATNDILAGLAKGKRADQTIIGFAAETADGQKAGKQKLQSKKVDAIVLNDVSRADIGFDTDENEIHLITEGGSQHFTKASKTSIARQVLQNI